MNLYKYFLYFDDTGNRKLGTSDLVSDVRQDGMNCFALGGILVKEEDIEELLGKHKNFCSEWKIDYPLHSSRIRGGRGNFGWLRRHGTEKLFLPALQEFLLSLPFVGIACVVNRPGYEARYGARHHNQRWPMSKTTFSILIERVAKFADGKGKNLEVYFEQSGKTEDKRIIQYMRDLKRDGNPFDEGNSKGYQPLTAEDYRRIVLGEPHRLTKAAPPAQIADLVLYPMAKGGYSSDYYPYRKLKEAGKLLDCLVAEDEVSVRGIKYSCF